MSAETMHPATRFIASLSKRLIIIIPLSMLAGLVVGSVLDLTPLKGLILPLTMLMVYPMLINFRPAEAISLKDFSAVGVAMLLNFVAWPLLTLVLARVFFANDPGAFVGLLLVGIFPTSGMTISWTGLADGNVGAAVKMTVVGLLGAAVLSPLYLLALAGTVVEVDVLGIAQTVALVIFVPMAAGTLTRRAFVSRMGPDSYKKRVAPMFPGLSTVGVMAIVFLAIGLKAPMILADPAYLLRVAVPLLIFYVIAFAVATIVGRSLLCRGNAIAAVYGSVMRNLSIALGIAIASFGPEAALVLAAAYIVQVQGAAWYVKLSRPAFSSADECVAAQP